MIGTTKLTLNQETLMLAVQEYLDKHIVPAPALIALKPLGQYDPFTYEATINDAAPEEKNYLLGSDEQKGQAA